MRAGPGGGPLMDAGTDRADGNGWAGWPQSISGPYRPLPERR